jgi:hypothetical protein
MCLPRPLQPQGALGQRITPERSLERENPTRGLLTEGAGTEDHPNQIEQTDATFGTTRTDQASVMGQATVPINDGGLAASQVRQANEVLGQLRMVLDQARVQSDAAVTTAWVTNEGEKPPSGRREPRCWRRRRRSQAFNVSAPPASGPRSTFPTLSRISQPHVDA